MNALVVGAGEMGRWMGELLHSLAEVDDVAFADRDQSAADAAAADVGGRVVSLDGDEAVSVVCIAVPIPAAPDAIRDHAERAERAILDVCGTMAEPVAAMADAGPDLERMSLHPLFAPPNEPGNVPVVVDAGGPVTDAVQTLLEDRGNTLYETTPAEHDSAMETVQARTHAAVLAYGLAAEDVPEEMHTPISAALSDLVEQVTGGDERVYADIQAAFDGAEDVAAAARRIADADHDEFAALFEDASEE